MALVVAGGFGVEAWVQHRVRNYICSDARVLTSYMQLFPSDSSRYRQWEIDNNGQVANLDKATRIDNEGNLAVLTDAKDVVRDWDWGQAADSTQSTESVDATLYAEDLRSLDNDCHIPA